MNMELCDLPAHQIVRLIRQRQCFSAGGVRAVIKRIAAVDGRPGRLDAGTSPLKIKLKVPAFITWQEDAGMHRRRP